MPPFRLRPYQKAAVSSVVSRFAEKGERRMLLYLPTGAGKTVVATYIIKALRERRRFGKTLFVAHRREILDQTVRTLRQHLPRLEVQVDQGERKASGTADITVASVQSLVRRKDRYDPKAFDLVICDECHRALAPTWADVIDYFWSQAAESTLLLGMTATPRRSDGRSVLDVFGQTAFEITRTDLEDLGYLVPIRYFTIDTKLRLDRVKLSGGDFQVGALSKVMDTNEHRALAIKAWFEQGVGKRTIVFCAGVEHAEHLALDFRSLGITAEKIDGKTQDRHVVLERFRSGEIQVLTNYGVLTEGFDDPGVACILMARPTTSPLVYTQCVGRGLRKAPGKEACTVLDLVDRSTHQLQYDAVQMAGLPTKWRCRGRDPFREAKSLEGIKVTSPEAFLSIRNASSLEEVQSILMSLPPGVVVAGLDGEPVPRYEPTQQALSSQAAEKQAQHLLRQAGARGARVLVENHVVQIRFRSPEVDNERYAYLKWHIERATGHAVEFAAARSRKQSNPRALLRSILPEGCRITGFEANAENHAVVATVSGLPSRELDGVVQDFLVECGVDLEIKGQLSLF